MGERLSAIQLDNKQTQLELQSGLKVTFSWQETIAKEHIKKSHKKTVILNIIIIITPDSMA